MPLFCPVSYANKCGATVFTVLTVTDDLPDSQEELETLLHKTGLKEPCVYKYKETQWCRNAMQLTPSWLKSHYGTLPLSSVREESATQVQLSQRSLLQAIELIESSKCQDDVSFLSVFDKKIACTLKTCNDLSSLPFQGTRKSSINLLAHEPFLCPLNYEEKQAPITLPISFYVWQKMLKHDLNSNKNTSRQLSCMHKKFQSTFDNASLTLPNHITFLDVSNGHHVEHLHQNMLNVSSVIVQTHGQQTVVLMPPISEQNPHHHWLDLTGQFFLNKEINLSASHRLLSNDRRLAHAMLYSVYLNRGDVLLVPANWFIYRKSLSTSISLSLNYLSDDKWRLFCFQAEPMEQKHEHDHEYLTQERRAIKAWTDKEIQQHPNNEYKIIHACKKIQAAISDAKKKELDLVFCQLHSLPDAIFRIPHLKILDLSCNDLTSFSLSHMEKLESLSLVNNKLTSFSLSHMKNLERLELVGNELTSFSFSLNHVENLVSLHLGNNQFTSFSLSDMKNLKSLDLSKNQLSSFTSCNLPSARYINLSHNHLFHLSSRCISSINTHQVITLYLHNNPLSIEGITQIEKDLLQRKEKNVTRYPFFFSMVKHIKEKKIEYKNFRNLLSDHHMFPSPENDDFLCPITQSTPRQVIFFMINDKCYTMYDAEALIQWIYFQSKLAKLSEEIEDPSTRIELTCSHLISAEEPCILEYFKKKLGPAFTENRDMIHDHTS